ncbi:MAG: type II secretion system protein [Planctomycetota bacterium]
MCRIQPLRFRSQSTQTHRSVNSRSGFTLTEMIATFVLLGAAITLTAPFLVSVSRQRLAIEQRQFAIQHAGNVLERYSALPWEKLSPRTQTLADVPAELQTLLPDLKQSLEITEQAEKPISRQLRVSITWRGQSDVTVKPVQLSAWIFQAEAK